MGHDHSPTFKVKDFFGVPEVPLFLLGETEALLLLPETVFVEDLREGLESIMSVNQCFTLYSNLIGVNANH